MHLLDFMLSLILIVGGLNSQEDPLILTGMIRLGIHKNREGRSCFLGEGLGLKHHGFWMVKVLFRQKGFQHLLGTVQSALN